MPTVLNDELTKAKDGSRIGILGGAFDPPHLCHQLLGLSFLALEPIDELWVIPCSDHAFKSGLTEFNHRFAMTELAFERINHVRVLDIENKLEKPSYTIQTLEHIKNLRPDLSLRLAIGSDLILGFDKWQRSSEISQFSKPIIFNRQSYPIEKLPAALKSARIHQGYALPDTNSTALRKFFRQGIKEEIRSLVDQKVLNYIEENDLYQSI